MSDTAAEVPLGLAAEGLEGGFGGWYVYRNLD
jgi:hypothetical protein